MALPAALLPQNRPPSASLLSDEDLAQFTDVRAVLMALAAALTAFPDGPGWIDIKHLDPGSRALLGSMLGDGEVAAKVAGPPMIRIQESGLCGVWMVESETISGIEVAVVPHLLGQAAASGARLLVIPPADRLPIGVMNVMPILTEIQHRMAMIGPAVPHHGINLTLLPVTPDDIAVLESVLGRGGVDILSRGYGNCRIQACQVAGVWRTQYFNSEDRMILDEIVIGDIPVAASATPDDISDSRERLQELLQSYFPAPAVELGHL